MLTGKKIMLGVSGSIAAYKTATLVRLLVKAGAEVQVLMTPAATDFITPLTLSTLSKRPVYHDVSNGESWNNHVELGLWADVFVIAPATATTLGKLANGLADNMLVATYLSARCPVFFAPAMDLDMWAHPSTRRNLATLASYGNRLIDVGTGELASGLSGAGRMAEPEEIVGVLHDFFQEKQQLKGQRALVTAGPTFEALDPVRFLGNRSTGTMGVMIALELAARGASVDLVLGPSALQPAHPNLRVHRIESAQQMYEHCTRIFPEADLAIMAAAVADYRPKHVAHEKIKKTGGQDLSQLELERTPDIAATLGKTKRSNQTLVGFALETTNEAANAEGKLRRKNFDYIVLNSLREAGAGFGRGTNKVSVLDRRGTWTAFDLKSKQEVACDLIDLIAD